MKKSNLKTQIDELDQLFNYILFFFILMLLVAIAATAIITYGAVSDSWRDYLTELELFEWKQSESGDPVFVPTVNPKL